MKQLRVGIENETWENLQPLLTHHGELSFMLRQAINKFIDERTRLMKELKSISSEGTEDANQSRGRRSTKSNADLRR